MQLAAASVTGKRKAAPQSSEKKTLRVRFNVSTDASTNATTIRRSSLSTLPYNRPPATSHAPDSYLILRSSMQIHDDMVEGASVSDTAAAAAAIAPAPEATRSARLSDRAAVEATEETFAASLTMEVFLKEFMSQAEKQPSRTRSDHNHIRRQQEAHQSMYSFDRLVRTGAFIADASPDMVRKRIQSTCERLYFEHAPAVNWLTFGTKEALADYMLGRREILCSLSKVKHIRFASGPMDFSQRLTLALILEERFLQHKSFLARYWPDFYASMEADRIPQEEQITTNVSSPALFPLLCRIEAPGWTMHLQQPIDARFRKQLRSLIFAQALALPEPSTVAPSVGMSPSLIATEGQDLLFPSLTRFHWLGAQFEGASALKYFKCPQLAHFAFIETRESVQHALHAHQNLLVCISDWMREQPFSELRALYLDVSARWDANVRSFFSHLPAAVEKLHVSFYVQNAEPTVCPKLEPILLPAPLEDFRFHLTGHTENVFLTLAPRTIVDAAERKAKRCTVHLTMENAQEFLAHLNVAAVTSLTVITDSAHPVSLDMLMRRGREHLRHLTVHDGFIFVREPIGEKISPSMTSIDGMRIPVNHRQEHSLSLALLPPTLSTLVLDCRLDSIRGYPTALSRSLCLWHMSSLMPAAFQGEDAYAFFTKLRERLMRTGWNNCLKSFYAHPFESETNERLDGYGERVKELCQSIEGLLIERNDAARKRH